jgi:hypothetical protein
MTVTYDRYRFRPPPTREVEEAQKRINELEANQEEHQLQDRGGPSRQYANEIELRRLRRLKERREG